MLGGYHPYPVREELDRQERLQVRVELERQLAEVRRLREVNRLYRHWLVHRFGEERVRAWEGLPDHEHLFGARSRHEAESG